MKQQNYWRLFLTSRELREVAFYARLGLAYAFLARELTIDSKPLQQVLSAENSINWFAKQAGLLACTEINYQSFLVFESPAQGCPQNIWEYIQTHIEDVLKRSKKNFGNWEHDSLAKIAFAAYFAVAQLKRSGTLSGTPCSVDRFNALLLVHHTMGNEALEELILPEPALIR